MVSFKILISVGRENPIGTSATSSQKEEKIQESKSQQEVTPESETRGPLVPSMASEQQLFFPSSLGLFVCTPSLWAPQEEPAKFFLSYRLHYTT